MKIFLGTCEKSAEHILIDIVSHLYSINHRFQFYYQASSCLRQKLPIECRSYLLYDSQLCSVMGLIEPLKRLPQLYKRRRDILSWIKENRPFLVIGIDAPDFWLPVEYFAKKQGLYSIHIVSPSVWAWRKGRVNTVSKSCFELYTLFSFEKPYYKETDLILRDYPHPLVRTHLNFQEKKKSLSSLAHQKSVLLCAPGSREQEIRHHLPIFLNIAKKLLISKKIELMIIPVTAETKGQVEALLEIYAKGWERQIKISFSLQESLSLSTLAIAVSGTVVFECALFHVPTIVCYDISKWKKYFLSKIIKTQFISLPNIILGKSCFPEFIGPLTFLEKEILSLLEAWLSEGREGKPNLLKQIDDDMTLFSKIVIEKKEKICLKTHLKQTILQALMKQEEVL